MSTHGSTAMGRELGDEMRRRRDDTGLTLAQLSESLGWSISRISRIENGMGPVSDIELTHYLAHVGLSLAETLELVRFQRDMGRGHWLSQLASLAFHEATAVDNAHYQPIVVHGLLQTEDYARALISRETWRTAENVESCVRARLDRQAVLDRGRHVFYLHEQVLRVQIRSPRVMHEQLLKLALIAGSTRVQVRVVPLGAGERSVFGNSFTLLDYDASPPLLYLDNRVAGVFFEDPGYVNPFVQLLPDMSRVALDTRGTQELLMAIAGDYERAEAMPCEPRPAG